MAHLYIKHNISQFYTPLKLLVTRVSHTHTQTPKTERAPGYVHNVGYAYVQ